MSSIPLDDVLEPEESSLRAAPEAVTARDRLLRGGRGHDAQPSSRRSSPARPEHAGLARPSPSSASPPRSRSSSSCARREQVVPHDRRLPDRRGAAPSARAAGADRARPAHPRVAAGAAHAGTSRSFNIFNYTLAHDGGLGRRASRAERATAPIPNEDIRFAAAGVAACGHLRRPQLGAARAHDPLGARATRERSSSRTRPSRPTSCSPRSASRSPRSGLENPWLIPFALAPLLLIHRSLCGPAARRPRRGSTRRRGSSTPATSPPRSPRSSAARSASSGRCR